VLRLVSRVFAGVLFTVQKKKKSSALDVDDLFASGSDDLFGSLENANTPSTPKAKSPAATSKPMRQSLSKEGRAVRFNQLRAFVSDRIGLKPVATTPEQVRKTAWQQLFSLATSREELESVTELFSKWRDSRRVFDDRTVTAFVRKCLAAVVRKFEITLMFVGRCEELHCADLALNVFGNHPKYGFPITSLPVARHLMHSLHVEHPLSSTITLVALYRVYNLPSVSTDLVSASMLASACFKNNTSQSNTVARALVPSLQNIIKETSPIPLPPKGAERAKEKEKAWLARTLAKIEKALVKQSLDYRWLRDWRERSGHLSIAA
jgi:hypothetical protein